MLEAIKNRVSIRAYQDRIVNHEILISIAKAGQFAPSGRNVQQSRLLIIEQKEDIEKINHAISLITKDENRSYFYNAPALIIVTNKKSNKLGIQDASCILTTMMIEATQLQLGTCWINQVSLINDNQQIRKLLGLLEDEIMIGSIIVGYPKEVKDRVPLVGNQIVTISD